MAERTKQARLTGDIVSLNVRMPPEVYRQLRDYAARENISLNAAVLAALKQLMGGSTV